MSELDDIHRDALKRIEREMKEICGIWNEIGLSSWQKLERGKAAWDHIHILVQDMKKEEIALLEELKDKIRSLTEKVSSLSCALSAEPSSVAGLTYLQRLEVLEQDLKKLNDMRKQRMEQLNDLRSNEKRLCAVLGMEEYKFTSATEIPSETDLKELQQYVRMLTEEHNKRWESYRQAKKELSTIFEVTETTPETTLEKHICSDKEPISLSKSTFQEIEELIARAKKRKEKLESKKKSLLDKLNLLWDRLNIEKSFRIDFISNHADCKVSTLNAIQCEVDKYEEMKKQNLNLFIDSVRIELGELWDKCGVADFERGLFNPYFGTDITESILIIHEEEIDRWKKYYEEVQLIMEKIRRREGLWELLKALDNKANDPERFKNRGGNLLQEEKERNKLLRTLPTLEKEIVEAIDNYETEKRRKFFYFGEDYRTVMSEQWAERTKGKENAKPDRYFTPKRTPFITPKKSPRPRLAIYRPGITPKRTVQKRELNLLKEADGNLNQNPTCSILYSEFEKEVNRTGRKSLRSSTITSKKIGGTRTLMHSKKRTSIAKRHANLVEENNSDST